jgi:hypothetical protein
MCVTSLERFFGNVCGIVRNALRNSMWLRYESLTQASVTSLSRSYENVCDKLRETIHIYM